MTDEVNISQAEYEIYQGWFVSHRFFRRVSFTLGISAIESKYQGPVFLVIP